MGVRDASGPVVMVVDDFADTRLVMRRLLEMSGCRVVEAANGREAVERAEAEPPQLILMDLNMPVLDGFSATLRIREHGGARDVPIVAVTAFDTAECRRAAEAVGCNDYVAKPVDYERIMSLLRRFLPTPLQQRESAPVS